MASAGDKIIAESRASIRIPGFYGDYCSESSELCKNLEGASWCFKIRSKVQTEQGVFTHFDLLIERFPKKIKRSCCFNLNVSCSVYNVFSSGLFSSVQDTTSHRVKSSTLDNYVKFSPVVVEAHLVIYYNAADYVSKLRIPEEASKALSLTGYNALEDPTFSDFTFIVQGKEFKLHKVILGAASPVMRTLFTANYDEAKANKCNVDHVKPNIFEALVRFIYYGEISEDINEFAKPLLEAAHYYEVEALKKICAETTLKNLTVGNALELLTIAHLYDLEQMQKDSWRIVKRDILKLTKPLKKEPLLPSEVYRVLRLRKEAEKLRNEEEEILQRL